VEALNKTELDGKMIAVEFKKPESENREMGAGKSGRDKCDNAKNDSKEPCRHLPPPRDNRERQLQRTRLWSAGL